MISLYTVLAMNKAVLGLFRTNLRYAEMLIAAGKVVDKRSRMINSAMQSPHTANYLELGKIVPEKVAAFGDAAEILMDAWAEWQEALAGQIGGAAPKDALKSSVPTGSAYTWVDAIGRAFEAPGAAMMPVHKAATENARRLRTVAP